MYAEERREQIAEMARIDGRVVVADLADRLGVTRETVRRDLDELEAAGVLRRVHGGAIAADRVRVEADVAERAGRMADQKRRIAKCVVDLLPSGGTVYVDAGTTTRAIAEAIPDGVELTVVTNSLGVAQALARRSSVTVRLAGGRLRTRTEALVGDWAVRTIEALSLDLTVVATNGVSVERGLSTPDPEEAAVKRAAVQAGQRVLLATDHTKIGDEHFTTFAALGDVDLLVTDDDIDDDDVAAFTEAGVEVVRA
jgi:DeoR family fructose operon transcriptional repressor